MPKKKKDEAPKPDTESEASKQRTANESHGDELEQPHLPEAHEVPLQDSRSAIYAEGAYPSTFKRGPGADAPDEPDPKDLGR